MLRYSHQMPTVFEEAFIKGLVNSGIVLTENWRVITHLLNLLSLLDCLVRSDPESRPKQCEDIIELISHILREL